MREPLLTPRAQPLRMEATAFLSRAGTKTVSVLPEENRPRQTVHFAVFDRLGFFVLAVVGFFAEPICELLGMLLHSTFQSVEVSVVNII
mmetsp:Transcript_16681/g.45848  ORF Transcript_16681/g.45848 Transcript_16681/m.45848 type:complete len:89 (+) Transcript_16681:140-406(+)